MRAAIKYGHNVASSLKNGKNQSRSLLLSTHRNKAESGGINLGVGVKTNQIRKYTPAVSEATCWNCKTPTAVRNQMFCPSCAHLQDVDMEANYFDLMNFPKTFVLEAQELTKRFRQLQTLVHPDKFSNKTEREQINSADWSALINKAYKTLAVPIERGQYMLKLQGEELPQDNSALNKEFLMSMMERNEEVEEAQTSADLERLNERILEELNDKALTLRKEFEANSLANVKTVLVEMKYLLSIQKTIKNKLQAAMVNG